MNKHKYSLKHLYVGTNVECKHPVKIQTDSLGLTFSELNSCTQYTIETISTKKIILVSFDQNFIKHYLPCDTFDLLFALNAHLLRLV